MHRRCASCSAISTERAKFCGSCGARMEFAAEKVVDHERVAARTGISSESSNGFKGIRDSSARAVQRALDSSSVRDDSVASYRVRKALLSDALDVEKERYLADQRPLHKPQALSHSGPGCLPEETLTALKKTVFVTTPELKGVLQLVLTDVGASCLECVTTKGEGPLVERVRNILRRYGESRVKYLVLLGNWDDVPPVAVPSPLVDDYDSHCLSDLPYVALNDGQDVALLPGVAVSRIPRVDRSVLFRLLTDGVNSVRTAGPLAIAVSAECWREATLAIVDSVTGGVEPHIPATPRVGVGTDRASLLLSPHWDRLSIPHVFETTLKAPSQVFLFNVHGSPDVTDWFGDGGDGNMPHVFGPGLIANYERAVVFSEACYGGAMGFDGLSVIEDFFLRGGTAFVGSSVIAYGSSSRQLGAADLMAKHFLVAINRGTTLADAMNEARVATLTDDPRMVDYAQKTVLSFNLFGFPWVRRPSLSTGVSLAGKARSFEQSPSVLSGIRDRVQAQARNQAESSLDTTGISSTASTSLSSIRDSYRNSLTTLQRRYLASIDEARARLRTFRDYDKIKSSIVRLGADPENFRAESVSCAATAGFRLHWSVQLPTSTRQVVVLTDELGVLKRLLISR